MAFEIKDWSIDDYSMVAGNIKIVMSLFFVKLTRALHCDQNGRICDLLKFHCDRNFFMGRKSLIFLCLPKVLGNML